MMSFVEALTNVGIGYLLAVLTQLLVFPFLGLPARLSESLILGGIFTAVSVPRSYAVRRLFEGLKLASYRRRTAAQCRATAMRTSEVD